MERALITGGLGLVGSHIADGLVDQGTEVIVLDDLSRGRRSNLARPRRSATCASSRATSATKRSWTGCATESTSCSTRPPYGSPAARRSRGSPSTYSSTARRACSRRPSRRGVRKVVAASSASVYGLAERFPTPEEHHPYANDTVYGAAKLFNEGLLRSYHAMYGLDYVALRYFNVYGPRMDIHGVYTEVLVRWIERIAAGRPPLILGDGRQTMDFIHVADIARANLLAAKSDVSDEVLNIASGVETSLTELAHKLLDAMGADLPVEYGPPRSVNNVARRLADTTRARERLGFRAEVPLEEGLGSVVEWWRAEHEEVVGAWM